MTCAIARSAVAFLNKGLTSRSLIWAMAVRDLQKRYVGTFAGLVWSVIHPVALILVYWLVFSVGLKVQPVGGAPFVVVFFCALTAWTLFAESLSTSVNAISGNPHFVKKVVFPTEILPLVNIVSGLITHTIMLGILLCVLVGHGITLSWLNLQVVYYALCLCAFSLGLAWLLAALNVFFRDVGQFLAVVLNIWFWLTPIVWPITILPPTYGRWIKLNPMFYVVQGYKNTFVYHVPFWQDALSGVVFWGVTFAALLIGASVFRRLKPEFPEVI